MSEYRHAKVAIDGGQGPYEAELLISEAEHGRIIPRFTREVAERIANDCNELHKRYPGSSAFFVWLGNQLNMYEVDNESIIRMDGESGYYAIGAGLWTWVEVTD